MSNVLAIAGKELRAYFASPIAYVVVGVFALMFGYFYYAILVFFVQQGMRMGEMGAGNPININQMMLRPLLINASILVLFVLPMITMRTFSEEKRSGTFELLLTSPLTDMQIIMGKFIGAMALYSVMLLISGIDIALLFYYGDPEIKPVLSGYLGLLLMGGCFISVGMFISSLTRNQIVAAVITFSTFLMLWVINWIGDSVGPGAKAVVDFLSITTHYEDFVKGVLDTKHLIYYVSFISFGLFLTARSVDSERWRG